MKLQYRQDPPQSYPPPTESQFPEEYQVNIIHPAIKKENCQQACLRSKCSNKQDEQTANNQEIRNLWEILKSKLDFTADREEYQQYLNLLTASNQQHSINQSNDYEQIYFKITILLLAHEILYLNIDSILPTHLLAQLYAHFKEYYQYIGKFLSVQYLHNVLLAFIQIIHPLSYLSHALFLITYLIQYLTMSMAKIITIALNPLSLIIDWSTIINILIYLNKVVLFCVCECMILWLSFSIKRQSHGQISKNQRYASNKHLNSMINKLISNRVSFFASQFFLLLFSYLIIGYTLSVLVIPVSIIKIGTYFIFLVTQSSNKSQGNPNSNNNLSVLSILVYLSYDDDTNLIRIIVMLMQRMPYFRILLQCKMNAEIMNKCTSQQHYSHKITQLFLTNHMKNITNRCNIRIVILIVMHVVILLLTKQYKTIIAFISVLGMVKLIQIIDNQCRDYKYMQLIQHQREGELKQGESADAKYEENKRQYGIQYKDYRAFWDIELPFQQYH